MKRTPMLLIAAALTTTACGISMRESFERDGLTRAAFELSCPADQLKLTALRRSFDSYPMLGDQVGVEGCGQKSVYVFASGAGWVLNSTAGSPAATPDSPTAAAE